MSIGGDWSESGGFGGESLGGDSFTEVSSQGWFSRIGGALIGIPFGLLLFLASPVLLFWNEGRSVRTARSLAEGEKAVVSVGADRVEPTHESALVHVSGTAATEETIKDPQFLVSARALRLERVVKMYQWNEKEQSRTRRKLGGGEERTTEYTYDKDWADRPIDSGRFKVPAGHENPREWPFRAWSGEAGVVTLGAFRLPSDLVRQINKFEPLPVAESASPTCPGTSATGCELTTVGSTGGRIPATRRSATSRSSSGRSCRPR